MECFIADFLQFFNTYFLIPSLNENNFSYSSLNKTAKGNKLQDFIVVESS